MIKVTEGYCAIKVGRYWVGATPGWYGVQRVKKETALRDAKNNGRANKKHGV